MYQLVELIQVRPNWQLAKGVYLNGEYIGSNVENAIKMLEILSVEYRFKAYRRTVSHDAAMFPLRLDQIEPSELINDHLDAR